MRVTETHEKSDWSPSGAFEENGPTFEQPEELAMSETQRVHSDQ
jgi:hypothetical protein